MLDDIQTAALWKQWRLWGFFRSCNSNEWGFPLEVLFEFSEAHVEGFSS